MVTALGSAHARGAVTTFTTGVLRFPSRVLRPRRICGQCYHPRGAGGLVQLDECLHVVSAGLARIRRPPWSSRTLLRVTWQRCPPPLRCGLRAASAMSGALSAASWVAQLHAGRRSVPSSRMLTQSITAASEIQSCPALLSSHPYSEFQLRVFLV